MNFIACVWYSPLWWYDLSWDLDDAQNEQKEKKKTQNENFKTTDDEKTEKKKKKSFPAS